MENFVSPPSITPPDSQSDVAAQVRANRVVHHLRTSRPNAHLPTKNARQTILFLGNAYNRFSLECFQALLGLGTDVLLTVHDPLVPGLWRLTQKRLRVRGWDFVLRKSWELAHARARIALRRIGIPLSGFATLAELCSTVKLKLIHCTNPNRPDFVDRVRALGVDLIVVANFNLILKPALLSVPRLGAINVHPSFLPKYRGPSPIYWVLAKRETSTGVTIHYIDESVDTGDIIAQKKIDICSGETQKTLWDKAGSNATALLREVIPLLLAGRCPRVPQDHSAASYYSWPPKGTFSM